MTSYIIMNTITIMSLTGNIIRGNNMTKDQIKPMANDPIRPNHYKSKRGLEAFDVMEDFIGELTSMEAFYWCNVVKYILRFQNKNGLEDLEKAQYYLSKLIVSRGKKEWLQQ